MPRWFDNAAEQLEAEYEEGKIDYGEFHDQMRDLQEEARGAAEEAALEVYRDEMGWF